MIGASAPAIVDSHHHLWDLDQNPYPWLQATPVDESQLGDYSALRRSYLIDDYLREAAPCGVVRSVHVQAEWDRDDPVGETRWLQQVADRCGFPHAIVAAVELERPGVGDVLAGHAAFANTRGVRQLLDADASVVGTELFERGADLLAEFGFSFDLSFGSGRLAEAAAFAGRHPELPIALNHCGLPADLSAEVLAGWRRGLRGIAVHENVVVKVSGVGMFDHGWTPSTIRPVVEELLDVFGVERCLFGSNFPVDRLYASYAQLVEGMADATSALDETERRLFFHDNAMRFYRLA